LALALGIPVEELKDRITAKEKKDWERFRVVYGPFGWERQDYNAAMIVSAIYLLNQTIIACHGGNPNETPSVEDCKLNFKFKTNLEESQTEITADDIETFIKKWKS
jgi:hypothetical protein